MVSGQVFLDEQWAIFLGNPPGVTKVGIEELQALMHPDDAPRVFSVLRETIKGEPDERLTLAWHERLQRFYARIKRAEFQSLTRVEIEMADRNVPERRYISVLELMGTDWKLVSLRVFSLDPAERLAEIARNPS